MRHTLLKLFRRLVTVAVALNIIFGSLYPVTSSLELDISDKLQHFIAYFILAFVLGLSSRPLTWRLFYLACAAGLGALIEIIQPFVGRQMALDDFLVDLLGVAVGGVLGVLARPVLVRWLEPDAV
ncbi:hypothetical protein JCM17844_19130 [Iodidimonas gelatinilytica]|uniref:VanZ-like domain-containing protein n=1 Tax=Iodidimonas gelatinilytica TaxID=1236966 RepID=A0A5A7MR46_9PROT|nr:VanZ family protein [Iodidimonas gelatinilytica]GEQ98276.1 hypothetical protein JCM17844_19130 [Iodidimonas gelatinilytica]